jgi:hypothetical protein
MNSNPEFAQLLNNPEMLRESLRMAANPVRVKHTLLCIESSPVSPP